LTQPAQHFSRPQQYVDQKRHLYTGHWSHPSLCM